MSYTPRRRLPRFAIVLGCAAAGALAAVAFAPEPAAKAALPAEILAGGVPARTNVEPYAESERLAERYLSGGLRLRAAGRVLDVRRSELGASVRVDHLGALLQSAQDARSPLRKLHQAALPGHPVALPMPAQLDPERTMALLLRLKDEVDRDPVDAHVNPRKREIVRAQRGQALDLHASLERLERALAAGTNDVELPLLTIPPRRTMERFDHVDMSAVLGEISTRYNQADVAADRTHNLEIAAQKVDGYVLEPGEVFDFNAVVGDRTQINGFKPAPVIAYGQLVDGMGGGTCQVASTLHGAVFFAGLPILTRHPHSRPSYYAKLGLDAAVAYGSLNFRFQNDRPYPIVLEVAVENGIMRAAVHGKENTRAVSFLRRIDGTRPFTERTVQDASLPHGTRVLAQRGIPGFNVTRFRAITDLTSGVTTRERLFDIYPPTEQVWRVGSGAAAGPDYVPPRNDSHPEYVADELMIATQGPGIDGTRIERTEGRTGTYGWTAREGMGP